MVSYHLPRSVVVAICSAACAGCTYYASHGDGQMALAAGAVGAGISAGLAYNTAQSPPPQTENPPVEKAP